MTDDQAVPLPTSAVLAAVKAVREDGWSDDTLGTIDRVVRIALAAAAPALRTPGPVAVMQNTQATWLELPASWPDGRDVAKRLTEMLVSRYSGQPTPRDLDVAKVAYAAGAAAERGDCARLVDREADRMAAKGNFTWGTMLQDVADLIRARNTP